MERGKTGLRMKRNLWLILLFSLFAGNAAGREQDAEPIVKQMALVNEAFMSRWPIAGDSIRIKGKRSSNIWTRSVYMEGLLALNEVYPQEEYVGYAMDWAVANLWGFNGGPHTRNADNQCCAQVYIDLFRLHGDSLTLGKTERMLNNVVNSTQRNDWWWIDALQMAMPVYAKMGSVKHDLRYFHTMMELYDYTKNEISQVGLFNPVDGLWWRDADFIPPYKEPNGMNCYWSRGNGWVFVALARTLEEIERAESSFPSHERAELTHTRDVLAHDFVTMAWALKECQREDGFWNCSLMDEYHYGGPEATGTSLFVCGMAWGIRKGILSSDVFGPAVQKAWRALSEEAVRPDGTLAYVQGTGKEPKDGQPVSYDSQPDFDDFGVGCFLLAGAEMAKLANQ